MSIDALRALISRMKAFVSVDTGPIYIAEAFDVPTIDIIGPMDENEQPPRGARHINVVDPLRGEPIIHIMNSRIYDKETARKSIENISVKMVTDAFDDLYKILDK
jgi:ADP-heptose:LPS heptosyltransferase